MNDDDYNYFKNNLPTDIFNIIKDSDIINCKISNSWQYQQIVKSQLHRIGLTENYVCLDSDSYLSKIFMFLILFKKIFHLQSFISRKSCFHG